MQFNPVNAISIIGYCVTFYHFEADYPVSCDLRSRKKSLASTVVCCWQQFQRQDKCIDCLFVFSGNVNVQDKCASAVAG